MGMAASQARFLGLTARKSNVEYEGQQINQQRTALGNQTANYYNQMLGMSIPVPPAIDNYTKTIYTFSDGALKNSVTSLIARNNGLYSVSYLRQWQDDFSIVSAITPIITDNFDGKYRVGAQTLRSLGGVDDPDAIYKYGSLTPIRYSQNTGLFYTEMETAQAANTDSAYDSYYTAANKSYEGTSTANAYRDAANGGSAQDALNSFVINDRAILQEAAAAGNTAAIDVLNAVTMKNSVLPLGALTYADGTPTLLGKWSSATASYRNSAYQGGMDEYYRILQAMIGTNYNPNPADLNQYSGTYNGNPITNGSGNLVTGTTYNADGSIRSHTVSKVYTDPGNTTYTASNGATITLSRDVVMTRNNQGLAQTMGEITDKLKETDPVTGEYIMLAAEKPEEFDPNYFAGLSANIIRLISNYERDAAGNVINNADGTPKLKSMLQKTVDVYQLSTSSLFGISQPTRSNTQLVDDGTYKWITDMNGEKIYRVNRNAEYIDFSDPATKAKLDAAVAAGTLYNKGSYYSTPSGMNIYDGRMVVWSGNVPQYPRWGNAYNTSSGLPFGDLEANFAGGVHNASSNTDVSFMGLLKSFEDDFAYNLWLDETRAMEQAWATNPSAAQYNRLSVADRNALFLDIANKLDAFYASFSPTPVSYAQTDDEYLNSLSPEQQAKVLEQEREYLAMLNQKYGASAGGWLVRYIKNTTTGAYEPMFYRRKDLDEAIYNNPTDTSLSYIQAYKIGSEKKQEEIKNVNARLEQDSTGRIINITLNPGTPEQVTYALTTTTVAAQARYDDAINQYEYDKYRYDQAINEINAKIQIIQAQDKNLELRLKQLDTEQNAIQTEMDAVSKVIQKNVESTFKTFG